MSDVQETLAELICLKTGRRPNGDDSLETLEIDSLAMAELTLELEQAFDVRVGEDVLDVHTVHDLTEYLVRKIAAGREPA